MKPIEVFLSIAFILPNLPPVAIDGSETRPEGKYEIAEEPTGRDIGSIQIACKRDAFIGTFQVIEQDVV